MQPTQPVPFPLNRRRRFDAALAYQGRSLRRFASALGRWTAPHIAAVMAGERTGSAALLDALRRELGEPAWLFVTGQTDTLSASTGDHV